MLVDAHTHIWQPVAVPNPAQATIVSGQCAISPELLLDYLDEHAIDRAVIVQPMYPGEDNSYVADAAARHPQRLAAVCVVDPRRADAADRLEYWVQERGCRGLRLRPRIGDEAAVFGAPPSTWPLWEAAQRLGIAINVLANPEHLPTVGELAERFPAVPIVIDHLAHPHLPAAGGLASNGLLSLSRFHNVRVKTSGCYYFSREPYPFDDCRELARAVYHAFGPERLLWGSDFPHVLLRTGYGRSLRIVEDGRDDLFGGLAKGAQRELLLGGNALRLYWPNDALPKRKLGFAGN